MGEQQLKMLKQNGKGSFRRFLGSPTETIRTAIAERKEDQDGKREALALLEDCKMSRLAALTKVNSSTTHLSTPPPVAAPAWDKPIPTVESASIVRIMRHSTLVSVPAEQYPSQEQLKRPPMPSRSSSGSILKNSSVNVPTLESSRRGSRKGSAVSWTTPSLGQICEGVVGVSAATTPGNGEVDGTVPLSTALTRMRTKMFRRVSWSSGEEEYEEIFLDGNKQVIFVWGEGVDDIIP